MSMCVEAVLKNPTQFKPGKPVDFLPNLLCQGDCTGHGKCSNGKCICSVGFDGTDCSVDTTKPPVIDRINSRNPCDLQQGNCGLIYLSPSNFYQTPDSMCHLRELKFSNGTFVETGYGFYTNADNVTLTDIGCRIPLANDVQGTNVFIINVQAQTSLSLSYTAENLLHY
ncbi:hypothetical protein CHS0354_023279 [Potamilus streckersoni]|uniref:EGF-like domain-containing protein n=1 Tax=Potamilus streckersoni TaxID=2493646 RepID=A0AAE0T4I7_9BIVA|nr:hypothetical protein CHS0354_023279 [Potamilus streckersoni]